MGGASFADCTPLHLRVLLLSVSLLVLAIC